VAEGRSPPLSSNLRVLLMLSFSKEKLWIVTDISDISDYIKAFRF